MDDYLSMQFRNRAEHVVLATMAALVVALLAIGCSKGATPSVSANVIHSKTAADVVTVLKSHNIEARGPITCEGKAPVAGLVNVIDCLGTTTDGKPISATLNASASGKNCTGPMVVNVGSTQVDSLPNEKCS